jgi:NADH dehydrogenase
MKKVALFGGTGFVGRYLTDALTRAGYEVRLLARPDPGRSRVAQAEVAVVEGTIGDSAAVRETLRGADVAIYNIGILREHPSRGITFEALQNEGARRVIEACVDLGVSRVVLMSANGVEQEQTDYQRTKRAAEKYLEGSGLEWTIFRPSVIFGDPRGAMEFATQLRHEIIDSPLPAPLFYTGMLPTKAGQFELSPVHVEDVAELFARSIEDARFFRRIVPVGGPDVLTWTAILRTIAHASGKRYFAAPVPACAVDLAARLFERFPAFPLTRDQLKMLLQGNVADANRVFDDVGIRPRRFSEESLAYLAGQ